MAKLKAFWEKGRKAFLEPVTEMLKVSSNDTNKGLKYI